MNKHLTGRENIHLYGSILGHSKDMMDSITDGIQFSELHDFIDEPLRTYSSGMKARLGISVATAVKPDILLIDEVLGVGDHWFQEKKSGKRSEKMMDDSNTVVIVSHSFGLLKEICDQMVMMEKGRIRIIGTPDEVIAKYKEIEG